MKCQFLFFFLLSSFQLFSQQTLIKSFSSDTNSIEISTDGLDEIKIINSENDKIEVSLFDENPNTHHVLIDEEVSVLKIAFKLQFLQENVVFRKYITKRLQRASAIIKLPKNKDVIILGKIIDVISKSYNGNLSIYIDKGLIRLYEVKQDAILKLFQGNVFATVSNSNINIKSRKGKILVDGNLYPKDYKKETKNATKQFSVSSINANLTLSSKH